MQQGVLLKNIQRLGDDGIRVVGLLQLSLGVHDRVVREEKVVSADGKLRLVSAKTLGPNHVAFYAVLALLLESARNARVEATVIGKHRISLENEDALEGMLSPDNLQTTPVVLLKWTRLASIGQELRVGVHVDGLHVGFCLTQRAIDETSVLLVGCEEQPAMLQPFKLPHQIPG